MEFSSEPEPGFLANSCTVRGVRHVGRQCVPIAEHAGDGIAQRLVDLDLAVRDHVHVHHHHAAGVQVLSDHGEELGGAHLEGNGDVLIRIDHDHVVLVMRGGEPGSAVIRGHGDVGGLIEVFAGQIGDLLVNLHAGDVHFRIILLQLAGVGAGAHAEDQRGIGIVGDAGAARAVS